MKTAVRSFSLALAGIIWFITMAGGWGDIAEALAGELPAGEASNTAEPPRTLTGTVLLEGDDLAMPTHVVVNGDELLLLDRFRNEAVFSVDRQTGQVTRSFGPKGEGPGEFKSPMSLVVADGDVAVLDPGLNRISWLTSGSEAGSYSLKGTTQIAMESVVTDFSVSDEGSFIVAGFLGTRRLGEIERDGSFLGHLGNSPDMERMPPERVAELFQGSLRSDPTGARHVVTSRFASHIEVLDRFGAEATAIWGPEKFEPHPGKYETRFGYLDSAPMSDGFLALYSGRTRAEFPGRANYAGFVDEFGWDGTHRARYELDADVITIAWSESDRRLYAVRHDLVPAILVYDLDQ